MWTVSPFNNLHVGWYVITEGGYWLNLGNVNYYEYTDEILKKWGDGVPPNKVVVHEIYEFITNFSEIFSAIGENIPDDLCQYVQTLEKLTACEAVFNQFIDQVYEQRGADDSFWDNYEKYESIMYWINRRRFSEWQFTNKPNVSFFRQHDDIHIVWRADQTEDGIPVWTAKTGSHTMRFAEFVKQIEKFGQEFSAAMETQIQNAIDKDWGIVEIDKTRLWSDQQNFKNEFTDSINILKNAPNETDWDTVRKLIASPNAWDWLIKRFWQMEDCS